MTAITEDPTAAAAATTTERNGGKVDEKESETLELTAGETEPLNEMETIPLDEGRKPRKKEKKPLDNNIYSTKKTVAQGMMDIALLTANASQLKLIMKYSVDRDAVFYAHVTFLCVSISLQIMVGVLLIVNSRYNINHSRHHSRADLLNNLTVVGVFLITVSNVLASSFGDSR